VLRLLAEAGHGLTMSQIAAATGLKRPTLHNLLKTLASREFVSRDGAAYRVGPALQVLLAGGVRDAQLKRAEAAVQWLARRLPAGIVSYCEPVGGEVKNPP